MSATFLVNHIQILQRFVTHIKVGYKITLIQMGGNKS